MLILPNVWTPAEVGFAQDDIRKLSGTIKDASANVQSGVTVYVYGRTSSNLMSTVITAADGTWSLSVNNDPAGYDAVWYVNGQPLVAGIMVSPVFSQ